MTLKHLLPLLAFFSFGISTAQEEMPQKELKEIPKIYQKVLAIGNKDKQEPLVIGELGPDWISLFGKRHKLSSITGNGVVGQLPYLLTIDTGKNQKDGWWLISIFHSEDDKGGTRAALNILRKGTRMENLFEETYLVNFIERQEYDRLQKEFEKKAADE